MSSIFYQTAVATATAGALDYLVWVLIFFFFSFHCSNVIQDGVTATGLPALTQLAGCTHPPAGARTLPVALVTGCSVLAQAALQTVGSVKPRRAFWEKKRKKHSEKRACFSPINHLFVCVCVFSPTFCAAGSSPAWRARALSAGRVADAVVTAAAGLVTPLPVGTGGACCQRGATISSPLRELC